MTPTNQTVTRLHGNPEHAALLGRIEKFVNKYVAFEDEYSLPIALWSLCTFMFPSFGAFPYVVITSETKRSGKTTLADIMAFVCSNPRSFGSMTPASMFRIIHEEHPSVFFDEAEELSSEAAGAMRSVLNMGYRKGSTVPRVVGNQVKEFDTYCPKTFILIGDVYDTLRDRSIVIRMKRGGDDKQRFVYDVAKAEGAALRVECAELVKDVINDVQQRYLDFKGIDFLTARDEEIWSPLFVMASVVCPSRMTELQRIAVDMATEKTQSKRRYVDMAKSENAAQDDEFAVRLLQDLAVVMGGKNLSSIDAVTALRGIVTAPWRKFKGDGITANNIADILASFGVRPQPIRTAGGRKNSKVFKGYKYAEVKAAAAKNTKR
jgi:hypothetical protein